MNKSRCRKLAKQLEDRVELNVRTGAEIGVWKGKLSTTLLEHFPNLHLYCVDIWEKGCGSVEYLNKYEFDRMIAVREKFEKVISKYKSRVIVINELSGLASALIPDGALDFVFIDAAHDYTSVANDIRLWTPKVKKGGTVCGHDYTGRWDKNANVKEAVDKFARELGYQIESNRSTDTWWFQK